MIKKTRTRANINFKDYLRVGDAAKLLGVCIQTLRNWDRDGKLKAYRHTMSSYRLYKREDLENLLEKIKKGE
jgi:DNA (cytosine-5)-methyltransferase 1